MELAEKTFRTLRDYIHHLCGLYIPDDKSYLVRQRLETLACERAGCNYDTLAQILAQNPSIELQEKIIAAITTNETSFFRDQYPFDAFRDHLLPRLAKEAVHRRINGQPRTTRIWSAGSSTGQEAYSLAILMREAMRKGVAPGFCPTDVCILGTDISSRVIEQARKAEFTDLEMDRGLPDIYKDRYFQRQNGKWRIVDDLRRMVEFRKVNLLSPFGTFGRFDVIFCRNVLIYFDRPTRKIILERLAASLESGGCLFLGSAENLYGVGGLFEADQLDHATLYRKI